MYKRAWHVKLSEVGHHGGQELLLRRRGMGLSAPEGVKAGTLGKWGIDETRASVIWWSRGRERRQRYRQTNDAKMAIKKKTTFLRKKKWGKISPSPVESKGSFVKIEHVRASKENGRHRRKSLGPFNLKRKN